MKTGLLSLLAVLGGLFCTSYQVSAEEKASTPYSGVKYPYKVVNGVLVYKAAANLPTQPMPNVKPEDFSVIYSDTTFAVGKANGTYYCNTTALPEGFDAETAKVLDSFLLSNVGTFAYCKPTSVAVDRENFDSLDFPFFTDGKHIFMPEGDVLEGADVATFQTKGNNQAFDKKQYYFREQNQETIPYQRSVNIYDKCFGWAAIDGEIYYRGEKQKDVDTKTFQCFSFTVAADKHGFYIYGKPFPIFTPAVEVKNLTSLSDYVMTDKKSVWFVKIEPEKLEGMNGEKATVQGNTISDGVNTWQCADFKSGNEPMCTKASE